MRVCVDASVLGWGHGGTQRYLRRVMDVAVEEPDVSWDLLTNARVATTGLAGEVPIRLKGATLWRNVTVRAHIRRTRPQVYWSPWLQAPYALPCPVVMTIHDLAPVLFPRSKRVVESVAYRTVLPYLARRASKVITDSVTTKHDVERLFGVRADRIHVVPLGVDKAFHPAGRSTGESVRRRWQLPAGYVLVVGSIEPRKGLEVIAELAERRPDDFVFAFAGRVAWGGGNLRHRVAGLSNCRLLGDVTDEELVELYQAAGCVAVPSFYEGFGLGALEALACGTPIVIAENSGSLNEVFGSIAVTVPERSAEAWGTGLRRAMADRDHVRLRGPEFASHFTWGKTARATIAVLREAAE